MNDYYGPLQVGLLGILTLLAMVPLTATLERWESAETLWTAFAVISVPAVVVARFWWPRWLTPRWHKDWLRRGGDIGKYDVPLGGPAESPPPIRHRIDSRTL
jgi:hypothetical protein